MLKILFKIKNIIILMLLTAVVTAVVMLMKRADGWTFKGFGQELKIDPTENVVEQIKKISELATACYYQEMVITKQKVDPNALNIIMQALRLTDDYDKDELALIVKGEVRAGFSFESLNKEKVHIVSDTLFVTLPQPKVLDVIINPSGYEIFAEDGKWSHQNIVQIQKQAEGLLEKKAIQEGILKTARLSGVNKLTTIFKTCGFSEVEFSFDEYPK